LLVSPPHSSCRTANTSPWSLNHRRLSAAAADLYR
jgi:hypothetical protein